jgi:hypothetical protein
LGTRPIGAGIRAKGGLVFIPPAVRDLHEPRREEGVNDREQKNRGRGYIEWLRRRAISQDLPDAGYLGIVVLSERPRKSLGLGRRGFSCGSGQREDRPSKKR